MDATRLRECLAAVGWSQRFLADRLRIAETRSRRWASGRAPIPDNVAAWLERLGQAHEVAPLPEGWDPDGREEPTDQP